MEPGACRCSCGVDRVRKRSSSMRDVPCRPRARGRWWVLNKAVKPRSRVSSTRPSPTPMVSFVHEAKSQMPHIHDRKSSRIPLCQRTECSFICVCVCVRCSVYAYVCFFTFVAKPKVRLPVLLIRYKIRGGLKTHGRPGIGKTQLI